MSTKRLPQDGFSLIEMIVTIVLFGVMAAVGGLMISKLAPSYLASVQAEQALSPREAAMWRLSEDFRRSLVYRTNQAGCTLNLNIASGVGGVTSEIVAYQLVAGTAPSQLWVSTPTTSGMLLDNVIAPGTCIFNWQQGAASSRTQLGVNFIYSVGTGSEAVPIPVSTILYTYAAAPYVSNIFPITMHAGAFTSSVSISGVSFSGTTDVAFSPIGVTIVASSLLGDTAISATINSPAPGVFDLIVTTPEGKTTFQSAVRFLP